MQCLVAALYLGFALGEKEYDRDLDLDVQAGKLAEDYA